MDKIIVKLGDTLVFSRKDVPRLDERMSLNEDGEIYTKSAGGDRAGSQGC